MSYESDYSEVLGAVIEGRKTVASVEPKYQAAAATAKLNDIARNDGGVLAPMFRRIGHMGKEFAIKAADGGFRFQETTKTFIGKITASNSKLQLVKAGDQEVTGVRSIAAAGLPAGKPFFVNAIRLRQATHSGTVTAGDPTTLDEAATLSFDIADKILTTGNLTIKVGDKEILPKLGLVMFDNKGNSTQNPGLYVLGNGFWIMDGQKIDITIDEGSALPAKTFVRMDLIGIETFDK